MSDTSCRYAIFVEQDGTNMMFTGPLGADEREYLLRGIVPALRPLSDDEYLNGPIVILNTLARYSYVLVNRDVFWCVEWEPGLIVVRFSPNGAMAWAAFRSQVPEFGRRTPTAEDLKFASELDPDADNPQYNLVFDAWDAQFEEDEREYRDFEPASADERARWEAALAHAIALGERVAQLTSAERAQQHAQCMHNLAALAGGGVRVRL
jgi:hypothetical protein